MLKLVAIALFMSYILLSVGLLAVYYQIVPEDPTRAILGGFAICMFLGTSPVWWPWLKGTNV